MVKYSRKPERRVTGTQNHENKAVTKNQNRQQASEELLDISDGVNDHYIFGGKAPLARTTINRFFRKGIEASGVKRIRIHDMRHSHATWLINNGANIVAVSKRLGHASIEQTLKTYTHLLQDTDDKLLDMIETEKKNW